MTCVSYHGVNAMILFVPVFDKYEFASAILAEPAYCAVLHCPLFQDIIFSGTASASASVLGLGLDPGETQLFSRSSSSVATANTVLQTNEQFRCSHTVAMAVQ